MRTFELSEFSARPQWRYDRERAAVEGRRILVTGAGGSIGGALSERLSRLPTRRLILMDRCEHHLYELQRRVDASPEIAMVLGDAGDVNLLEKLLPRERPDVVIHAAAHKHAPLLESQQLEAVRNNFAVTASLLGAVARHGVDRFVLLSTDKAVEPAGIMGVSKRLAELALLTEPEPPAAVAVRLGNVWGSRGSVIPAFLDQLAAGESLTVTHRDVSRYFLSEAEAVSAAIAAMEWEEPPAVLVPRAGQPLLILDIARALLERSGDPDPDARIVFTGLRSGDKLAERLSAADEVLKPAGDSGLLRVEGPVIDHGETRRALGRIEAAVARWELAAVLAEIRKVLPGIDAGILAPEVPR